MPFRSRSSHSLLALVVGSLLLGAALGSASIAPPPELSDGGYLQVGLETVRVSVENPHDFFWVGEKAQLIQKNIEYFVGILESEYEGDQVFAVPRVTWNQQGTAWVTEQNEIVFGVPTYTVRGSLFLRPGEWLTVLDEDESRYRVLCSRYGRTFPIELKKSEKGITYQADLPAGVEARVVAMHAQSGLMARARPIITDETLREMGASVSGPNLLGQQPVARQAIPTAPPANPSTASVRPPLPDPQPLQTATAATPSPGTPQPATRKDSKWLISNTAWSQELNQGDARVITPETVHTALEVDDAPDAVTEVEAPPPNVASPPPAETVPTLVASAPDETPEMPPETPSAQPTEPATAGMSPAPEETPTPEETVVASAAAETAAQTNAPTELAVAAVPPPISPPAAPTTGAVATVVDYPTQRAEESPLSVAVKIILLTVAVLAVGVAVFMGLAWILNRRKTPRRAKARQETETAKEERPRPTRPPTRIPPPPPPPVPVPVPTKPETEPAPASALPDDFSDRISFNGGVFTGTLDALTVSQLIQFIHSVEETGSLSVTHGSGLKAGKVMVRQGDIIDAQCEGQRGEDALREIITFKNGIFAFTRQTMDDHAATVSGGTMAVLMNVLKDFDEASEEPEAEEAAAGIL